jgi:chemotaxis protein CheD
MIKAPLEKPLSVYLKPAELFVAKQPAIVTTVLGSCVSVTLFHQRSGLAAICHAPLPQCRKKQDCTDCHAEKYKYVACVVPEMIQRIARHCIQTVDIEVKLFGGAEMFANNNINPSVGRQNVESAIRIIAAQGLRVKRANVGGLAGRKIFFYTHTGQVFMKQLNKTDNYIDNLKSL